MEDDGSEGEGGFGVRAKPGERAETALEGGGTCRSADERERRERWSDGCVRAHGNNQKLLKKFVRAGRV